MTLIYDIRRDQDRIEGIQQNSLSGQGLSMTPALFGSEEFWRCVDDGTISTALVDGRISVVVMGGHGDSPEFTMHAEDGRKFSGLRFGDQSAYVVGKAIRLEYVYIPWANPSRQTLKLVGPRSRVELRIWIE